MRYCPNFKLTYGFFYEIFSKTCLHHAAGHRRVFAVGGAVLVNGSFMDRLSAAAEQEQSMHAMLCGVVEDYYLDQTGRGEDTCGDDFITAATWRAGDLARGALFPGAVPRIR